MIPATQTLLYCIFFSTFRLQTNQNSQNLWLTGLVVCFHDDHSQSCRKFLAFFSPLTSKCCLINRQRSGELSHRNELLTCFGLMSQIERWDGGPVGAVLERSSGSVYLMYTEMFKHEHLSVPVVHVVGLFSPQFRQLEKNS